MAVHDGLAVREAPLALVEHPQVVVGAVALQDRSARRVKRQERSVGPAADPAVARQLRAGTVGHNSFRTDFQIGFGGFKQSGIGREGGREGLVHFLETKTVILDEAPAEYRTDG